jgi:hypothetical protein
MAGPPGAQVSGPHRASGKILKNRLRDAYGQAPEA